MLPEANGSLLPRRASIHNERLPSYRSTAMKQRLLLLMISLLSYAGVNLLYAQEAHPIVVITTSHAESWEGDLDITIVSDEADFDKIWIDTGYGKKKTDELNDEGRYPAKGNSIKVYGPIRGVNAPSEVTRKVEFADNSTITDVAITNTALTAPVDFRPCSRLRYVSLMACDLKTVDFSLFPASIEELHLLSNDLTEFVLPKMPSLINVDVAANPRLSKVDFSQNPQLNIIDVSSNPLLKSIDLSQSKALTTLTAYECALRTLDVSACDAIEQIAVWSNQLTDIKLGNTESITLYQVSSNDLPAVDAAKMPKLYILSIGDNPRISSIDLSKCPDLMQFSAEHTAISSFVVNHLQFLELLNVGGCPISRLDLSGMAALKDLSVERCYTLSELNIDGCSALNSLLLAGNKLDLEVSARIAEALSVKDPMEGAFIGFYRQNDDKECNAMYQADVEKCVQKGFEVLQLDGESVSPYTGIAASLSKIYDANTPLFVHDDGSTISIEQTDLQGSRRVSIYDMKGERLYTTFTDEVVITVDKSIIGSGKRIVVAGTQHRLFML